MSKGWEFISNEVTEATIGAIPISGKHQVEPLASIAKEKGVPFNILEDEQFNTPQPEVHLHEHDLWYGLEGELKFILGGEMIEAYLKEGNANEVKAREISGGEEVVVKAGDVLFIRAGTPHAHTGVHGRAYIIKIPEKNIFSLDQVPGWK